MWIPIAVAFDVQNDVLDRDHGQGETMQFVVHAVTFYKSSKKSERIRTCFVSLDRFSNTFIVPVTYIDVRVWVLHVTWLFGFRPSKKPSIYM